MSKPDYKTAKAIVDTIAAKQTPGPNVDNEDAWRRAVRNGIRSRHWQMILEELDTGASPEAIIATITNTNTAPSGPTPPQPPTFVAGQWTPPTDADRELARARLAQIRESLRETA